MSEDKIKPIKPGHIRTLERRMRYLQALIATDQANDWDRGELAALQAAIAELNEILLSRQNA